MFFSENACEEALGKACDYMSKLLSSSYLPEGTPTGRGPLRNGYHGNAGHEFTRYTLVKQTERLDRAGSVPFVCGGYFRGCFRGRSGVKIAGKCQASARILLAILLGIARNC